MCVCRIMCSTSDSVFPHRLRLRFLSSFLSPVYAAAVCSSLSLLTCSVCRDCFFWRPLQFSSAARQRHTHTVYRVDKTQGEGGTLNGKKSSSGSPRISTELKQIGQTNTHTHSPYFDTLFPPAPPPKNPSDQSTDLSTRTHTLHAQWCQILFVLESANSALSECSFEFSPVAYLTPLLSSLSSSLSVYGYADDGGAAAAKVLSASSSACVCLQHCLQCQLRLKTNSRLSPRLDCAIHSCFKCHILFLHLLSYAHTEKCPCLHYSTLLISVSYNTRTLHYSTVH